MELKKIELKKSYKSVKSLEQFSTGGPYVVASDGSFMVCACNETLKLVDLSSSMITSTIEGDFEPVTALALNPNSNNILFSASHSRLIRVWDLSTLKFLRSWKVIILSWEKGQKYLFTFINWLRLPSVTSWGQIYPYH